MTRADRDQLARLSRQLHLVDWNERTDGFGIVMLAGSRGHIKPVAGALMVTLRPAASAAVRHVKLQLLEFGLLSGARDTLALARMPSFAEAPLVRELLGLGCKK